MRELMDFMPMVTALVLAAVSIAGALVGAWAFANYLALAMTSLLVVWLFNRFTPDSIR
jgi:hypothetical protein